MHRTLTAALVGAALLPLPAVADEWGCTVLLCLADPAGPMAQEQCRPPIEKLWDHLRRGRPFPSCALAGPGDGATGAQLASDYFDPCPAGTAAARAGLALRTPTGQFTANQPTQDAPQTRWCVGGAAQGGWDADAGPFVAYPQMIEQRAYRNPMVIDVFIDGQRTQRVRVGDTQGRAR